MNKIMKQTTLTHGKLLGLHESYYMTLISIVEGGVFGCLVYTVSTSYNSFAAVAWLGAVTTFLTIVLTWHEYVMGVAIFDWVPKLQDSLIPFLLAVTQIWACYTISENPKMWFMAMSCFCFVSFIAFSNMFNSARQEPGNAAIIKKLGYRVYLGQYMPLLGAILFAIFNRLGQLFDELVLPAFAFALVLLFVVRVGKYWAVVVRFAKEQT